VLSVNRRAAATIRELVDAEAFPRAGLRITAASGTDLYDLAIVPEPQDGDITLTISDAHVYIDAQAASELSDATLVASESGVGVARFALIHR
jgi:Fe-S cluster assembly iron-binding protein IscA